MEKASKKLVNEERPLTITPTVATTIAKTKSVLDSVVYYTFLGLRLGRFIFIRSIFNYYKY